MIKRKMMDWRWISPTTITTTLSSTSTKKYSYQKINNYIIIFIIYTILFTSIGCSPTRKPVHNFQIENIEPHKRDELKKLLITVYSKEDQQSDDENEILVSDWSEREKRTLPSPGENDIEGHHTTEKGVSHHPAHPQHHATTESHIEVLLKDESEIESVTVTNTQKSKKDSSDNGRKRRELPTQQQNFSLPDVLTVNNTESINVMVASTNGTKFRRFNNNINNDTITFNRQTEAEEDEEEEEEEEDDDAGGGGIGGLLKMFLAPLSGENGGIDLDVVAALIGSLSAENPDGTYDFSGITGVVGSLFGPDEDGNGGSDVGSFLGGILSATIAGLAGPKGAKGAGTFLGNLLSATLPGLSAPAEKEGGGTPAGSDSSGFLAGLITSVLGGSSSTSSGGGGEEAGGGGSAGFFSKLIQIKLAILRSVFSIVTGLLSSSSR